MQYPEHRADQLPRLAAPGPAGKGLQENHHGRECRMGSEPHVGRVEDAFSAPGTPHLHWGCPVALVVLIPLLRFTGLCKK